MSYQTIGNAINTILTGIVDIKVVFNDEPKELAKYPAATVSALGHTDRFIDTHHNNRVYSFMVRLYYRTEEALSAETVLRKLADTVITTLETNVTLNNSCDFARPTEGKWGWQEREVPVRTIEITILAEKRFLR